MFMEVIQHFPAALDRAEHLWSNSASWVQCGGTTAFVRGCLAAGMEGMDLVPGLGFFTGLGAREL
jgi:hypothetical protein